MMHNDTKVDFDNKNSEMKANVSKEDDLNENDFSNVSSTSLKQEQIEQIKRELEDDYINEEDAKIINEMYERSQNEQLNKIKDQKSDDSNSSDTVHIDNFHKLMKEREDQKSVEESFQLFEEMSTKKKHKFKSKIWDLLYKFRMFLIGALLIIVVFFVILTIRLNKAKNECNSLLLKEHLSRTSLVSTMLNKGYSNFEINHALSKSFANYEENAYNAAYDLLEDSSTPISKKEIQSHLKELQFSDNEIDYALNRIDWNDFLSKMTKNVISRSSEDFNKHDFVTSLSKVGYTTLEVQYVSNLADWQELAKDIASNYLYKNKNSSKEEVKIYLDKLGFNQKEIENAYSKIDWNKQASIFVKNYLQEHSDDINNKKKFYDVLSENGFSDEEIEYALNDYDFSSVLISRIEEIAKKQSPSVKPSQIKTFLLDEDFSEEEIDIVFKKISWIEHCQTALNAFLLTSPNKKEAAEALKESGYEDEDITIALNKITWREYAYKALQTILQKNILSKDDALEELKNYGYTDDEISYASSKIAWGTYAYNYLYNEISSSESSKFGRVTATEILENGGYNDEISIVFNRINWNSQASNYLNIYINECCNSVKDSNGYEVGPRVWNEEGIKATMTKYGFTQIEVGNAFSSINWNSSIIKWAASYAKSFPNPSRKDLSEKLTEMNNPDKIDIAIASISNWRDLCIKCGSYLHNQQKGSYELDQLKIKVYEDLLSLNYSESEAANAISKLNFVD